MRKISCLATALFIFTITQTGLAQSITIDTPVEGDDIVNASESGTVTISGTSSGGTVDMTIVRVTIGGVTEDATITGADGPWTVDLDISGEANGPLTVAAIYDPGGVNSAATNNNYAITLDQADPSITTVTPSPTTISDSDLGVGNFTITVAFDEPMIDNGTQDPTISFDNAGENPATTVTLNGVAWSDNQTFVATYDVADANVDLANVDVLVSGGQDAAGNDITATNTDQNDLFSIDTDNPSISTVTPSPATISDSDAGVGNFTITVAFDEPMIDNGTQDPTISFDNAGENPATTLTLNGVAWSDNQTFVATYDVADANVDLANVDVLVSGGQDALGNGITATNTDQNDLFSIDTDNPSISTVTPSPATISDSDAGVGNFTITVAFDEPMIDNGTQDPTISFDNAGENPATTLTLNGVAWSDNQTFVATYDVADANVDLANVDVLVSGGQDALGNGITATNTDQNDLFSIDTENPNLTLVSFNPSNVILGVGDALTVTVTEGGGDIGLTANATTVNGVDVSGSLSNNLDGTYEFTYTVGTSDTDRGAGTIPVSFVLNDAAGNVSNTITTVALNTTGVDATEPSITTVTPSPTTISDSDLGVGNFTITVAFDEPMIDNGTQDPTISFDNAGENPATTVTLNGVAWSDNQTFVATYDVADANVDLANVDVLVSGGQDAAGNDITATNTDQNDLFSIDTDNPSISTVTPSPATISDSDVGVGNFTITVAFDEPMIDNGTQDPTISFDNAGENPATTLTLNGVAWSDNQTFVATYDVADANVDLANVDVLVSGGQDALGNGITATNTDQNDLFSIDTENPNLTLVSFNPSNVILGVGDALTVTVTEGGGDIGLTANATTVNGVDVSGSLSNNLDGTYEFTYTVGTSDTDRGAGTIPVSFVLNDAAGNVSNTITTVALNTTGVDATEPSITTVTPSPTTISDSDLGVGNFTITVAFDEPMIDNGTQDPTISFDNAGENPATTVTLNGVAWSDNQTFVATYDVADANVDLANVDVLVSGGQDAAGNDITATNTDQNDLFSIDTDNPSISTVTPSPATISDSDVGVGNFTITVAFDEPMIDNGTQDPTISFDNAGENPATTLTLNGVAWSDNQTFVATYDVADANVDLANVDVLVSGGQDALGNGITATNTDQNDLFSIDTENPTFVDATFYDTDTDGVVDEILLEFSEDMDESSIDDADFNIGGAGIGFETFSVLTAAASMNGVDATETDVYVTLSVSLNTTDDRTIVYTQNDDATDVSDAFGNQAADDGGLTTIDLAAPVLTDLRIEDVNNDGVIDQMTYVFSEIVFDIAGGVTDGDIGTLTMPDGDFFDGGGAEALGNANVSLTNDGTYGLLVMDVASAGYTTVGTDALAADGTGAATNFDDDQNLVGIEIAENIDDRAKPRIMNVVISGNAIADVTFSEPVWGNSINTLPVTAGNFSITLSVLTGETIDAVNATSVENAGDPNALVGGEEDIRIFFSFSGSASGGETLTVDTDGNIFDDSNNTGDATQYPTDNEDDLSPPDIPTITIAEWLDQNSDGDIDGVAITYNTNYDIDEDGGGDTGDGLQCFQIRNNGTLITQDGVDYDAINGNGFISAGVFFTLQFTGDPQPGTSIANLTLEYINDPGGNDRIESQSTFDDTPVGSVTFNGGRYDDGAAPRFTNFTATILDTDANGQVDQIQIDAQDNIDDASIDPSEFTYNGIAATGVANVDDTDQSFYLTVNGTSTSVEGDFVYTPGVSLLDSAGNASNGGTISSGSITDGAGPVVLSALTEDTEVTPNGLIDQITVTFSESFTEVGTIVTGDFTIPGFNILGVSVVSPDVILTVDSTGTDFDTFVTPNIGVDPNILQDVALASNPDQTIGSGSEFTNTTDGAAPYSEVDVLATNDSSPEVTGTVDDVNATVLVNIGTSTVAATNNANGTWTLPDNSIVGLPLGNQEVTAICVDPFGNTEVDATSNELTINGGANITPAAPGSVCTGDGFQALGTIQITETGIGDFGSTGTILLTLPAGFEFNTAVTPNSTGSSLTDITVTFSYVGTATLSLNITYDLSDDGIDDLLINGLQFIAVTGGASGNLERAGGTASLLTTDTNYATLTSNASPADITDLRETSDPGTPLTSYTTRFLPRVTINYTIGPVFTDGEDFVFSGGATGTMVSATQSPTSFDMYLTAGTVSSGETFTGQTSGQVGTTTATASGVSNILLPFTLDATTATARWYNGAGSEILPQSQTNTNAALSATTPGLYTFDVTDDNATCESNPLRFNVLIYNDVHPDNNESTFQDKTYTVTDDRDTIYISNPAGHTVSVTGNGVSVVGGGGNPLLAIFDPEIAGDNGGGGAQTHTITYSITNNTTLESTSESVTFTVEPETSIFTGPPAYSSAPPEEHCADDAITVFRVDNSSFSGTHGIFPYINRLGVSGLRYGYSVTLDGLTLQTGGTYGPTPYDYNWDPTLFAVPAGDFENVRVVREIFDNLGIRRIDAENFFIIYGRPFVTLTNVTTAYCEDDASFTLNRTTSFVQSLDTSDPADPSPTYGGETNQAITNGYLLYRWNGAAYVLYEDFTGADALGSGMTLRNDFDPSDPNQNTVADANDVGQFRITYFTEALTPNSCVGQYEIVVNINPDTPTPTLNAATLSAGGAVGFVDNVAPALGIDDNEYLLEYCAGDVAGNFVTGDLNTVRWYDENLNLLSAINGLTSVTPAQVGLATSGGRWTEQSDSFYFTSTDGTGCESDYRLVTVEVYATPDNALSDITGWPASVRSGTNTFLDYCVPHGGNITPATVSYDPLAAGEEYDVSLWYYGGFGVSSAVHLMNIGAVTGGPYIIGETVTGGVSLATGIVQEVVGSTLLVRNVSGTFTNETITGSVSGATTSATNYRTSITQTSRFFDGYPLRQVGYLFSSVAHANYTIGETVTGGTSGATARVIGNFNANYLLVQFTSTTASFEINEIVTGGTSGVAMTMTNFFDAYASYYRYGITKTENINGASNFGGCTGPISYTYTFGQKTPLTPTIADLSSGVVDFHVSEGASLDDITHTNIGMDGYVWYENSNKTGIIGDTLASGQSMTEFILNTEVSFDPSTVTTPFTNDVYTYYFSRVDNAIVSRDFDGCESSNTLPVNITVHASQRQPTVVSNNAPGMLGTPNFTDLDGSANNFYSICTDQLEADIQLVATEPLYGGASREFRWYVSNASFDTRGAELATDGSGVATFTELGLAGLNPATTINRYFEVVQVTDNDVYAGVESASTFIRVDISPQDALEYRDDLGAVIGSDFCRDEGTIVVDLFAGGTSIENDIPAQGTVNYLIDSYLQNDYVIAGSPTFVSVGTPTAGNPTLDLQALHTGILGSNVGGEPSIHVITMNFTDATTLCTGTISKVITIHPDPHISFEVNGIDINDVALVDAFCYENGNVALQGVQYIYDNTGIIDTVNLVTGQFTSDQTGNLGSNVGQGTFNPIAEHNAANGGLTGTDGIFENRTAGSDVSLTYTDGFGCDRTISQIIFVDPEPEVDVVNTGSPQDGDLFFVTDICNDASGQITAEIRLIDPTDPAGTTEEDDYSMYTFDWFLDGQSIATTNVAGPNQENTNIISVTDPDFVLEVNVTDLNGCTETYFEFHQKQELPDLDFPEIFDLESFCSDDTPPTLTLEDLVGGAATVNAVDVQSWQVLSYATNMTDTATYVDALWADATVEQDADGMSIPQINLQTWHEGAGGNTYVGGQSIGGNSTVHTIYITYIDPNRAYQGTNTLCQNTYRETIIVNPDPNISILVDNQDVDDLQFCYDDINISLQGIDLGTGFNLVGGTQNIIRIDGSQVSTNGQAVFNAATYHGTNPGDEFLPQSTHTIEYVYEDDNGCERTVTRDFLVNPRPRFVGNVIQTASTCATSSVELFVDMTDGASNYTFTWFVNGQEVNGVDVIDEDGNNNDERITYDFGGQLTTNFGVTATYIGAGFTTNCTASIQNQSITVGAEPIPAIAWVGVTAGNPNGTDFTITEDNATLPDGDVDLAELEIDGMVELSVPNPTFPLNFNYDFTASGEHTINLTMNTSAGCAVTLTRVIRILPHYAGFNATNSYSESFETAAAFDLTAAQGGWLIDSLSLDGKNYYDTASSWTRGSSIPGTAAGIDGGAAVYTAPGGTNGYRQSEVSFVYSPSFDLSGFSAPTVSFLRYEDFETFRDGAVFQVSVDDGRTWQTVGTYNASLESEGLASTPGWYNREAISSSPGSVAPGSAVANNNAQVGWALNSDWQEAISPIEIDPLQSGYVRFRFALSAQAGAKSTNGFGFDLVRIYERNQIVLLELFSSTLSPTSLIVNDTVNSRPQYAGSDILKINYFTDIENGANIDQINQRNTTGPGAMVAFYGIGEVPSLAISGDANFVDVNGNSYSLLNAKLANARLNNPAFDIVLNASVNSTDGVLSVDASFTATSPFVDTDELALHIAVVEPLITLPASTGLYPAGASVQNVLRKLLPSAAGQFEQGPIAIGESRSLTGVEWPVNNMYDPSTLRVIAYIQDLNTKQIYQATFVDVATGLSSNVLGLEDLADFSVYPNPADKEVTVEFADGLNEDTEWVIFDQAGREVLKGKVEKGTAILKVETSDMPSGLYFIHLYGEDKKRRAKRVMILH